MKKPTQFGPNRTGIATSPIDAPRLIEGAQDGVTPDPINGIEALTAERRAYSEDADPLGTVPPPASMKGMAKGAVQALKGNNPAVFVDLLAERLAFARTGARLYEALLVKHDAADIRPGDPSREQLEKIRDDELRHFGLVKSAIEKLGGDPTVVTPSADAVAVASLGLVQLLSDPRTTFTEALKGILQAELLDRDSWVLLADVAERLGQTEMGAAFRAALAQEEDHLVNVRTWVMNAVEGQVGLDVPTAPADAPTGGARPTVP
jgi:rubrerythrin